MKASRHRAQSTCRRFGSTPAVGRADCAGRRAGCHLEPDIRQREVFDGTLWRAVDAHAALAIGEDVAEGHPPDAPDGHRGILPDCRDVNGFAFVPPVSVVKPGANRDVLEKQVFDVPGVAREHAQTAVRIVDDEVLKHAVANLIPSEAHAHPRRCGLQQTVGDGDVLGVAGAVAHSTPGVVREIAGMGRRPRCLAKAGYRDGVVAAGQVAVRHPHVARGGQVNPVRIGHEQVGTDGDATNQYVVAVSDAEGPLRWIQEAQVLNHDPLAPDHLNQGAGLLLVVDRAIRKEGVGWQIGFALAGVFALEPRIAKAMHALRIEEHVQSAGADGQSAKRQAISLRYHEAEPRRCDQLPECARDD